MTIIDKMGGASDVAHSERGPAPLQQEPSAQFDNDALGGVPGFEADEQTRLLMAIHEMLGHLERAGPQQVALAQARSLDRIVRHAAANTGFYRDRLRPVLPDGLDGGFQPEHWNEVPLLTRSEILDQEAALRAQNLPEGSGPVREGQTSGSTGTPLRLAWNRLASVSTRATVERLITWHGLDVTAALAEIRSFPGRTRLEESGRRVNRGWSFRGPHADYFRLPVTVGVERQLAWLREIRPRYLLTYPTLARELATVALAAGAKEPALRLDAILTVGEVMTPTIREACRAAFGAKVIDTYGCQELGKIALECDAAPGRYHLCVSNVVLEVLDERGRQVPPGGEGRLVVTGLYNYAMPFIRYEIGDYGRLGAGVCACGRSLPVLERVMGRRRNMITLADGRRLWLPGAVLAGFARFVPMRQMRLVQTAPSAFDLHYVPDGSGAAPDLRGLSAHAAAHIGADAVISPVAVESLPRSAGGKYEDVIGLA